MKHWKHSDVIVPVDQAIELKILCEFRPEDVAAFKIRLDAIGTQYGVSNVCGIDFETRRLMVSA